MSEPEILELKKALAIESGELLSEMEAALLALESSPGDAQRFHHLFRTVHTIKGSAGIVGYQPLEDFCHNIEHALVSMREEKMPLDRQAVAILLRCHDQIRVLVNLFSSSEGLKHPEPEGSIGVVSGHLVQELNSWCQLQGKAESSAGFSLVLDENSSSQSDEIFSDESLSLEDMPPRATDPEDKESSLTPDAPKMGDLPVRPESSVRVDSTKLDHLSGLIVELVTASSELEARIRQLADLPSIEAATHISDLIKRIQESSMALRMIPIEKLFNRFCRIVHDLGREEGKEIRLLIHGGETELDKVVAEKMFDPLLHLVRNALDHGIESPQERLARGKPRAGTIHLSALHDSGNIVITVRDDGHGIDADLIARKLQEQGGSKTGNMTEKELLNYIFEPGFTTRNDATMVSGRGVGMDVVKRAVESVRGKIDVETGKGTGTAFRITIPLSLSMVEGFMFELGEVLFIVPMDQVQETLEMPDITAPGVLSHGCLQLRGHPLPCIDLRELLGVQGLRSRDRYVVVIKHQEMVAGFIVDKLVGETRTVIKPLAKILGRGLFVSGAGILGDGTITLLLEINRVMEAAARFL